MAQGKRISQLTALNSASLDTVIVGIDNGATYRIQLGVLSDAVSNQVNILDRNRLSSLENFTASFTASINLPIGIISSSSQLTSSFDERYTLSGSIQSIVLPTDIISSSQQISDLGFITGVVDIDNYVTTSSFNEYTASISTGSLVNRLDSLESNSGSYETIGRGILSGSISYTDLTNIPLGLVSGSEQLTASLNELYVLSGSVQNIELPTDLISSSQQILDLGFASGSFETIGRGIISSSTQIDNLGYATTGSNQFYGDQSISGSLNISSSLIVSSTVVNTGTINALNSDLIIDGGNIILSGSLLLSGGIQFNDESIQTTAFIPTSFLTTSSFNSFTQSYYSDSSSFDNRIENINSIVSQGVPSGTVSGSQQILDLGFVSGSYETTGRSIISSSAQITTFGFISSSQTIYTGSFATTGSNQFNGDQTITGSLTATGNVIANNYVQTALLYHAGGLEIRSYYQPIQINSNGAGIQLNDSVNVTGGITGSIAATNGVISSSAQITSFGFISSSSTPIGTISSSQQITSFGFVSGSYETTGRGILSGSISYTSLTNIPSGIVSGASQILNGSNIISSSTQITAYGFVSGSYETIGRGIISSSTQIAGLGYATTSSLNSFTASYLIDSASAATTRNTNTTNIALLSSQTSSYETIGRGIISSSLQTTGWGYTTTSSFNTYTASTNTLITNINSFTASTNTAINSLNLYTASASTLTGNNTFTGTNVFSGSTYFSGSVVFEETREVIVLQSGFGVGTTNFDYNSGSVFYLNGLTGTGTWNVQNFVSSSQRVTALTFVVEQGATAYSASAYQLGGTPITVKWQNGSTPAGLANKTDIFALSVFRSGSTFNALGSYSTFG